MFWGKKFSLSPLIWLNIFTSLLICLIFVQFTLGKTAPGKVAKIFKDRHKTEKDTPLATAWHKHELEAALTEMGFNVTHCKERHWKKYVPEEHRENGKYRRVIRRLCKRYLLPNDADRMEAFKRYEGQIGRKHKFDEMVKQLLAKLSQYNETQEKILNDKHFVLNDDNMECYWKVYYSFSETCADPHFDHRVSGIRNIFANACVAPWLDIDKISHCFKDVCESMNLYEF